MRVARLTFHMREIQQILHEDASRHAILELSTHPVLFLHVAMLHAVVCLYQSHLSSLFSNSGFVNSRSGDAGVARLAAVP